MAQHSQTEDSNQSRAILEAQLRECFGRVAYSHKTHEKCADIYFNKQNSIRNWQIILSALSSGGFAAVFFGFEPYAATVVGFLLSTGLLVLNAYTKNYNLGELVQKHKQAATDLWLIRESYLSLLADLRMGEKPIETLQATRDNLLEQLHGIYASSPPTLDTAYAHAQTALQKNEELTFENGEIDAFLPEELRKQKKPLS